MRLRQLATQLHNAACETHGLTARQRIERSTAHIANKQERSRVRANLWAAEPDEGGSHV